MYNWDAPKVAEGIGTPPGFVEEGEIIYGQQGFDHFYLDTTSALLESGKEFFSDVLKLNHQREGMKAEDSAKKKKEDDAIKLEAYKAKVELWQIEQERRVKEIQDDINKRRRDSFDQYGLLGGVAK